MQYLSLFQGNSGYANAPQCNIIRTLSVLCHIVKSCRRFMKYSYRVEEERYSANDIAVFRALLCTYVSLLVPGQKF